MMAVERAEKITKKKAARPASIFDEVVDVIGPEAAAVLMEKVGGESFVIQVKPTDAMIEMIGAELGRKLCDEFRGLKVYVPKAARLDREDRNVRILEALARGASYEDAAKANGVTVRTVQYIRRAQLGIK